MHLSFMAHYPTSPGDEFLTIASEQAPISHRISVTGRLTDSSPMPMGFHRGKAMQDVPAQYLLEIGEKDWIGSWPAIEDYIERHRKYLEKEAERAEDRWGS